MTNLTCSYKPSDHSVFTPYYTYYISFFNHVGEHNKEAYNCSLTSVTDNLFVSSALPPYTNTHSSYQVKLQKEVKSTQKSQALKKVRPMQKKRQHAHKFA